MATTPTPTRTIVLDPPATPQGGALERIALALNSTLELREVLRALAGETLSLAGAGRTSVFLISDGALHPAASRATHADEELWDAFRAMDPIPLTPERMALLHAGQVLVVDDPASLCPPEWIERFDLHHLVFVPLLVGGEPCGLMTIDFPHHRPLEDRELRRLEAIGSYAGVAVRNARVYEAARRTARLQAGLAEAAAALASPLPPVEVAARLCAAATELLGVRRYAVALLGHDRDTVVPLLANGDAPAWPMPLAEVPEPIRERLAAAWRDGSGGACVFGDAWLTTVLRDTPDAAVLVLPLITEGQPSGAVVLSLDAARSHDAELLAVAEALVAIAGAALERHTLVQRQQQQLDRLNILYGLSSELAERADAGRMVGTLNTLLRATDVRVEGVAFRPRALVRHLGGDSPTTQEKAAWAAGSGPVLLDDGTIAVPMSLGRRLVGSLRVRGTDLDADDLAFLEALASGVAAVAHRGALRSSSEEASRERAVAAERERIAADLHDTVGQQFVALGLMANRLVEHLPAGSPWAARVGRLADLAAGGKFEVDQAVRALAFVPAARRGLVPAVHGLCRLVGLDSGLDIVVDVKGRPVRLPAPSERALYRVVHEALTNAWRHARCMTVTVQIAFARDSATVTVRDDGTGLGIRAGDQATGSGLWSMRRTVAQVDGSVRIRNAEPRGTEVVATVSRGTR